MALFINGQHYAPERIILAMGVSLSGNKQIVGMRETPGESTRVVQQMMEDLMRRGLSYQEGLLCVTDGSKGIAAALRGAFGSTYAHQRCRLHTIRNVTEHLSKERSIFVTKKLWNAYNTDDYKQAKTQLQQIANELRTMNPSAATSLEEGLEETLTLQRLHLNDLFSKGFGTTNCLESINSQLDAMTSKVKHWKDGDMHQRWVALAAEQIEPKLNRVANYRRLNLITEAFMRPKKRH